VSFRLAPHRACRVRDAFEVVFAVIWGDGQRRLASVRVTRSPDGRPLVSFPHPYSQDGESLGSAEADACVRERAGQFVVGLDAAREWQLFCRGAR
jgi:hypothetical protein